MYQSGLFIFIDAIYSELLGIFCSWSSAVSIGIFLQVLIGTGNIKINVFYVGR